MRNLILAFALASCAVFAAGQQVPSDSGPPIARPAYASGQGPLLAIDEAHKNTHTSTTGLRGMARLLERDGYRVRPLAEAISPRSLEGVAVLVIAQPGGWELPPVSLSDAEVKDLVAWVRVGGSLLLMLGHMPFPSQGANLATALGVRSWHDGYAMVQIPDIPPVGRIIFRQAKYFPGGASEVIRTGPEGMPGVPTYQGADSVLASHPITEGRSAEERVPSVMTFTGSAFQPPQGAQALLVLPPRATSFVPDNPGARDLHLADARRVPVGGWLQGAVLEIGKGRVALFGETALFSGQWPVHAAASQNYKLILNVMHWLTGIL